ncbi:MAG: glycosyltransferase [Clostridia bacterium]|nr:glycosyltransferase [Clostridia bacterium]
MVLALKIVKTVMAVIGYIFWYRKIIKVLSLLFTKKFPRTDAKHKYAVCIAARNEEAVIANLIESIRRQDYPSEYVTIFVVADNCTDKTAETARRAGAICYERFDKEHCTKGYALQYLFDCIKNDYGIQSFEGYFIFDADNLLKKDFISRMNDAFHSGEKVITSYRNAKNIDENPIASSYALHWLRTTRFESRGRSLMGISTRLQGTGFLFASELIKDGWNYTSLTEDREFTCDLISEGIMVTYQSEAEFYDEQPVSLKIAFRQRIRWGKGHLLAFKRFFVRLWKCTFFGKGWRSKVSAFDFQLTNFPYVIVMLPLKLASCVLTILTAAELVPWWEIGRRILKILIFDQFYIIPQAALIMAFEFKRMKKVKWWQYIYICVSFPLFGLVGDFATWIALFSKVQWKPIPHNSAVKIEDIEKSI